LQLIDNIGVLENTAFSGSDRKTWNKVESVKPDRIISMFVEIPWNRD
jgi:hypothetical protein